MTTEYTAIQGEINDEVVKVITDLIADVIGRPAVNLILNQCQQQGTLSGADLIYACAQETQAILGNKGGYATLRQVGRSLAKQLMANHPRTEWQSVLETALNQFGFASGIEKEAGRSFICNCVFYDKLAAAGLAPVEHTVCWAGWGFIEGFVRAMDSNVKSIRWINRDMDNRRCEFEYQHAS